MDLVLKINCDNAAFADNAEDEISRILHNAADEIAYRFDSPPFEIPLHDVNGNKVGTCKIE